MTDGRGPGRSPPTRPAYLLAAVALTAGAGLTWASLARPVPTAEQVRARLFADAGAGRFDRCAADLDWLSRHDRLGPLDLMARARVDQARGRLPEALASLEAIPDGDPVAGPARLQAALIEIRRDRAGPAEAALESALAREPRLTTARLELIRIYARQQRLKELDAQFEALDAQEALGFTYLSFWGMTRSLPWEPESDVAALRRSVEADPGDRPSRLALAEGLRRLGDAAGSVAALAPLPADDPDARATRAALALDRGELDEATRQISSGPKSHAGLARLRGQVALTRQEPAAAVLEFRAALAAEPDDRRALFSLGIALRLVGRDEEARRCLDAARRCEVLSSLAARTTEPGAASDADLHRQLGRACEGAGRLAEARAWYRLAIALDPLDAESQRALFRIGRASAAARGGDPETADGTR